MCKPRRVTITTTRELQEAWSREVSRSVQLSQILQGEARVTQSFADTLAQPVLNGIDLALGKGLPGWSVSGEGYRHEIEGGYVFYHLDRHEVEIVAVADSSVVVTGSASDQLTGQVVETLSVEASGDYYDDGWGGRTEAAGRVDAEKKAEEALARESAKKLKDAADQAATEAAGRLDERAKADAERKMAEEAAARQASLNLQASERLQTVGVRGRQVANRLLAEGYRAAVMAYARTSGADGIQCTDNAESLEIEFMLNR